MSAYIVDSLPINRVVTWLWHRALAGPRDDFSWCLGPLEIAGYDLGSKADCERLARNMFNLNRACVLASWCDASLWPDDFEFALVTDRRQLGDVFQVLKSLDCFLYQCDGDNVDSVYRALFLALRQVAANLCRQIILSDPRYDRAAWE
jgi:hypothetical protein